MAKQSVEPWLTQLIEEMREHGFEHRPRCTSLTFRHVTDGYLIYHPMWHSHGHDLKYYDGHRFLSVKLRSDNRVAPARMKKVVARLVENYKANYQQMKVRSENYEATKKWAKEHRVGRNSGAVRVANIYQGLFQVEAVVPVARMDEFLAVLKDQFGIDPLKRGR